jgi:hypothetical protein
VAEEISDLGADLYYEKEDHHASFNP